MTEPAASPLVSAYTPPLCSRSIFICSSVARSPSLSSLSVGPRVCHQGGSANPKAQPRSGSVSCKSNIRTPGDVQRSLQALAGGHGSVGRRRGSASARLQYRDGPATPQLSSNSCLLPRTVDWLCVLFPKHHNQKFNNSKSA